MSDLFADVNGIKICYDVHGEGDPIVLIHGFSDRKEHFRAQVPELSKHFKVIRLDNRGAGKSDRPDGEYTMEVYADDIKGLLDHLDIEKTHILGHSLGGMIAQNFVLKYPERVKKVVLLNTIPGLTPPGVSPDLGIEIYLKNALAGMEAFKASPINAFLARAKPNYSRKFWKQMKADISKKFHGLWSVEDLIEEKSEYGPTEDDYRHQAKALKTHNVYERLHEIHQPVLVLSADKDKTCPKLIGEKMHTLLPNSKFVVIKNAGHQSLLEYPHIINQHIIAFLEG